MRNETKTKRNENEKKEGKAKMNKYTKVNINEYELKAISIIDKLHLLNAKIEQGILENEKLEILLNNELQKLENLSK